MKKIVYLSLIGVLVFGMPGLASAMMCGSGGHKGEANVQPAPEEAVNVGNKACPVSGEHIKEGEAIKVEHEGKTYNFCCPSCIGEFKKDPQRYIEKLEAQEEKGPAGHEGHTGHAH